MPHCSSTRNLGAYTQTTAKLGLPGSGGRRWRVSPCLTIAGGLCLAGEIWNLTRAPWRKYKVSTHILICPYIRTHIHTHAFHSLTLTQVIHTSITWSQFYDHLGVKSYRACMTSSLRVRKNARKRPRREEPMKKTWNEMWACLWNERTTRWGNIWLHYREGFGPMINPHTCTYTTHSPHTHSTHTFNTHIQHTHSTHTHTFTHVSSHRP